MPNGISHPYQLDKPISNLRVVDSKFQFHSTFKSSFCKQTMNNVVSDLALLRLPMSHKQDARLKWVKERR